MQQRTPFLTPRLPYIATCAVAVTHVHQFPPILCAAMSEAIRGDFKGVSTRICMTITCTILTTHSESAILEACSRSSDVEVKKPGMRLQQRLWMLSESWAAGGKLRRAASHCRSRESHMAHEDAPSAPTLPQCGAFPRYHETSAKEPALAALSTAFLTALRLGGRVF